MEGKLGNPAPLGLMGFAMTTILLNIHNMGFYPLSSVVLSMGICYGGIAQVIAGLRHCRWTERPVTIWYRARVLSMTDCACDK